MVAKRYPIVPRAFQGETRRELLNRRLGGLRKLPRIAARPRDYLERIGVYRAVKSQSGLEGGDPLAQQRWAAVRLPQVLQARLFGAAEPFRSRLSEPAGAIQEGKPFYRNLIASEAYEPESPFLAVALDEQILTTVACYFRSAPLLQSVELIQSLPAANAELQKSQLWHCDNHNDTRILKLFVYLTDVGERNGPLSFLPASASKEIPWTAGHYIPDEVVARHTSLSQTVRFVGPAGSAVLVDTARLFHFGSRCEEPRLTFVAHYNTGFGFRPRQQFGQRLGSVSGRYSAIQRLALGL